MQKIEPNVAPSSKRFAAIKKLSGEGIFVGILLMPLLPYIEDTEENISSIIELAHESGAKFIFPAFGLTLRQNQRAWYYSKLDEHFPSLKSKYIENYGNAYECRSPKAKELWTLFQLECDKRGILYKMDDIIKNVKQGYEDAQISLFD